jgi:hypothetical protein
MRLVVLAFASASALAACTPDDADHFPIAPASSAIPALGGMQEGPDIGPDAGTLDDGGLLGDGGGTSDARGVFDGGGLTPFDGGLDPFLDAPPGGVDQIPGNPDQIP